MFRKKISLYMVALSLGMAAFTSFTFARERKKSYELSVYSVYQSLPANSAAAEKTVKIIHDQFPGWAVTTDKLSGMFTDIYGSPIPLGGNCNIDKVQNCFAQMLTKAGIT